MSYFSVGARARRLSGVMLGVACAATPLAAQTRTRAPQPPRPVPAPVPRPVPAIESLAALGPLLEMEFARAGADVAGAVAEAMAGAMAGAAINVEALRDMAEATAMSVAPLAESIAYRFDMGRGYRTVAPASWDAQDPADSLYRDGRKALSGDAYRKAADLFRQIRERYPKSSYAPDAPYWEAFALHRLGGVANLRAAREALAVQQREYPRAATRGDAASLGTRIDGQLGRRDAGVATTLMGRANRAADDGCPKDDERIDALNAVMQMDPEKAMPILRKVLARREACTQQLRRTAVWLVASRKQPESATMLMDVAKSDPDREVREQAVFWMANVPTEEGTEMLIALAKGDEDIELRKRAVYALSRSKSPKASATLRELALDAKESDAMRGDALNWYVSSGALGTGDDAMKFLTDVYGRAETTPFKLRILSSIASGRSNDARTFLVNVALNEREGLDVRRTVVSMINSRGATAQFDGKPRPGVQLAMEQSDDGVAALTTIYDRAADLEIRRTALIGIAASRNNAGIDKLIDVVRNEKNTELRKTAISWLSRTKDPRALALLQEIIDK